MIESLLLNSRPTSEKELDYQQTLSQKLQIQRELKQRIRANPLEFYWPHAYGCDGKSCNTYISHHGPLWDGSTYDTTGCPQYAFHTSLAGTRAYFGGNRAGKTTAVIVEIAFHTTGYYPDWYPKEKCYRRATRFRVFAEDFAKSVGEVITPKIDEWFPQGSIKDRQKNNQGVYVKYWIKHTSGKYSVFEVLSYEQDPGVAEGWCIEENQKVLMADGTYKPIKDIKIGDRILSTNDRNHRFEGVVCEHYERGVKEIVKLQCKRGIELLCTPEHNIWTGKKWVKAGELKANDKVYTPLVRSYSSYNEDNEKWFLIGAYLGDGWTCENAIFYTISKDTLKKEIEVSLLKYACYLNRRKKNPDIIDYRVSANGKKGGNTLKNWIKGYGLLGKKSYNKFVPQDIFKCSDENKISFLRGFIMTDGTPHRNIFYSCNKEMLMDISRILRTLGIYTLFYERKPQNNSFGKRPKYVVEISGKYNVSLFRHLLFSESLRVSTQDYKKMRNYSVVKKVEKNGSAKTFDLMIKNTERIQIDKNHRQEGQHSYICEGVRVKNCGDGVAYDEPPPREHRVATARGLVDFEGREMFALTPLKEPWLFDEVYESKSPDVKSFVADIRHNLHRINPLTGMGIGVTEKGIEILEKTLTEEEKEVRRHGRFRYLSGRIWKIWDRGVHTYSRKIWTQDRGSVIDGEPPRDWTRVFLIDPHDRRDHALLWVAKEKDYGRLFVYREALLKGYTFEETVDYIKEQETSARERILYRYIDPNFGPKNQANTNLTVRDTFEEAAGKQNYPMRFSFGDDHKKLGRQSVSSLLRYDINQPVSIINRPELIIADDCVNCIYQIEHYIWDDFKYGDRDAKEEEKPLNTCFPALLRYLALANINNTPPEILESSGALYT